MVQQYTDRNVLRTHTHGMMNPRSIEYTKLYKMEIGYTLKSKYYNSHWISSLLLGIEENVLEQ